MAKIIGGTTATTMPIPDWKKTDPNGELVTKEFLEEKTKTIVDEVLAALPNGDEVSY